MGEQEGSPNNSLPTAPANPAGSTPALLFSPDMLQQAISSAMSSALPSILKGVSKVTKSKSQDFRTTASASSSPTSSSPSDSPPRKRKYKSKHLKPTRKSKPRGSGPGRRGAKYNRAPSSSSSSSPSSAGSRSEDSSLSGDEEDDPRAAKERLFPLELLDKMIDKSASCLNLRRECELDSDSEQGMDEAFPKHTIKRSSFPFPKVFQRVISQEWESHSRSLAPKFLDKLYSLPDKHMSSLKTPTVDAPLVSLASSALPVDGEVWPKDTHDRRVDSSSKRAFELSSQIVRVSASTSIMARAAFIWSQQLAKLKKLPKEAKKILKRVTLASAFSADASLDSMRLAARAMVTNNAIRRTAWLHSWSGDASSHSRLINLPFEAGSLFGKALDPVLVESKDKKKVLPPGKKDTSKAKASSFRSFRKFRDQSSPRFKSRWTNARVLPRGKQPFSRQQPNKRTGQKDARTA